MDNRGIFACLRDALATLYPDEASARVVAADSDLDERNIIFSSRARDNWHSILTETVNTNKLDTLIDRVLKDYQDNRALNKAINAYRQFMSQGGRMEFPAQPPTLWEQPLQPLSPVIYAWISATGLIISAGLLVFMVFAGPRLIRQGMGNQVFYFLLIPLGLSAAAFVFGAMRSYATVSHKSNYGMLDAGGPIVAAMLVVVGGFFLVPAVGDFNITVRVITPDGPLREGEVRLIIGASTQSQPINTNGEAEFKALSAKFRENLGRISIWTKDNERLKEENIKLLDVMEIYVDPMAPTPTAKPFPTNSPSTSLDETLIIIAPFAGRLSDYEIFPEKYVRDALNERVERLNKAGNLVRSIVVTTSIETQEQARTVGKAYGATLVIWGEYDDVGGIRTFAEIMAEIPQPDIQQAGNWLPLITLPIKQIEAKQISRDCLLEGVPRQADYLATLALGIIELYQQQRSRAAELFTQAIEIVKREGDCTQSPEQAYFWRGFAHSLREEYRQARDDLTQAVKLQPEFRNALVQRGIVYQAIGNTREAQFDFTTALSLTDPEDRAGQAELLGNLGIVAEMEDRFEQAKEYYQRAEEINKATGDQVAQVLNLGYFGSLYQGWGELDTALRYHTQALTLTRIINYRQGEAFALGNIGLIHHKKGAFKTALDYYEKALAIDRERGFSAEEARQLIRIGLVYLDQQEFERALQFFGQALKICEARELRYWQARTHIGIGLTEEQRGNSAVARSNLQEALHLLEAINSPEAQEVRNAIQNPSFAENSGG